MTVRAASPEAIAEAADLLRAGKLVAFPTETVYGLGGDATSAQAVAQIYAAKGRPSFNPLIVHVAAPLWVAGLALPDGRFDKLTRKFWPGPLTLVMKRRPDTTVAELLSGGLDTIAVRAPDHPLAQALLQAVKRPLAAPSANPSGRLSPTTAAHVHESLGSKVDLILDGGACRIGLESTVLDISGDVATILRPGSLTASEISAVIGPVAVSTHDPERPAAPGQLASHYAPGLPVRLGAETARTGEALLGFGDTKGAVMNLSAKGDPVEAAANLFAMLRALDDPRRFEAIAVAPIPEAGIGAAINDRLRRAAAPRY